MERISSGNANLDRILGGGFPATSMFTVQDARLGPKSPDLSNLGDNVLLLEMLLADELTRTICIMKSRGSGHDGQRHPLSIGKGGLSVR